MTSTHNAGRAWRFSIYPEPREIATAFTTPQSQRSPRHGHIPAAALPGAFADPDAPCFEADGTHGESPMARGWWPQAKHGNVCAGLAVLAACT